jgi:hypothetical protein
MRQILKLCQKVESTHFNIFPTPFIFFDFLPFKELVNESLESESELSIEEIPAFLSFSS